MLRPRSPREIKYLTKDEIFSILDLTKKFHDTRSRAILTLTYFAGLRRSEVGLLKIGDLRLKDKRIFIHRLKGSHSGDHILSPMEISALRDWMVERGKKRWMNRSPDILFPSFHRNGKGVDGSSINRMMKKYGEKAGIDRGKLFPHALKHSICTHLLESGKDIMDVKDWVGHESLASTQVYAQITNVRREKVAEEFYRDWEEMGKGLERKINAKAL